MYGMVENDFTPEDKIKNKNTAVKKIDGHYDRVSTMIHHQVSLTQVSDFRTANNGFI